MGITPHQFKQMQERLGSPRRASMSDLDLRRGRGIFTIILEQTMSLLKMFCPKRPKRAVGVLGGLVLLAQADLISASPVAFTIDSTNSAIALSGSVTIPLDGVVPLVEQSPGSLTTHYSGTVLLDLTPPTIQFPGGSVVVAQTNGVWRPATGGLPGNAPADYGGKLSISILGGLGGTGTGLAAARNIQIDLTSLALTLTNSGFDASRLHIAFATNTPPAPVLDYQITNTTGQVTPSSGFSPLSGALTNSQARAYLTNTGGFLKLVIPVNTTNTTSFNSPNDTTMVLKGQLVKST